MARTSPEAIESRSFYSRRLRGDVTMRLELVDCGKARCGKWHGPYWHAYRKVGGRTFKVYVGKKYDERKAVERLRAKVRPGVR